MIVYKLQIPDLNIRITQRIPWSYAVIAMGYIIFWCGLRSGFVDTSAYIRSFEGYPVGLSEAFQIFSDPDGKDRGFTFLGIIFKTFVSTDFHAWLMFIALATGIPIMLAYRNHSNDYLYSIFLLVTSTTITWMFNGIRQFLAAAILFGFGFLIEKKRFIPFLIILLLCTTIHGSAWIVLPVYFFATDKPFGYRMLLFVLGVLLLGFYIGEAMDAMEILLEDTQYENNLDQFAEDDGVHPLRVLFSCIPVVLALWKRREILSLNNKYINMCVNMSTIAAGLYFIGMLTSGIMVGRLPIYFSLYTYILFPYLFIKVYPNLTKQFYIGFTLLFLIFYYVLCHHLYYISDILGTYF